MNDARKFAASYRDSVKRVLDAAKEYGEALGRYAEICRALGVADVRFTPDVDRMANSALDTLRAGIRKFNRFYDYTEALYSEYVKREDEIAAARAEEEAE